MATWLEFETSAPALAAHGRRLLYQHGIGLGFLATVRSHDGGPRVHPVCPIVHDGRLWVFVVEMSPKYADLLADPRFALHCFPPPPPDEEFYLTGRARAVEEARTRTVVSASTGSAQLGRHDFERLFELDLRRALHTTWDNWGNPELMAPVYERWSAGR